MLNKNISKKNTNKDLLKNSIVRKEKSYNRAFNNIFQIVENNNINKLNELLKKDHSKINSLNKNGLSPLHLSVIKGNKEIINILLLNGANPNILSMKKKQTPLHLAYIYKNKFSNQIIQKLKTFQAKENIYDIDNKRPIDYLNKNNIDKNINNNEIIKDNKNEIKNISVTHNHFSKMIFKIEGDIDNCENDDDQDFDNIEKTIKKKHYYQLNLKNINQINKNEININKTNQNENIFTYLSDSLENDNKPKDNHKINYKLSAQTQSRNLPFAINKKNKSSKNYRIIFNNIINNNLKKIKNNNEQSKRLCKNNSYIERSPYNNKNNIKFDDIFKEIIRRKRQSIKLRKSNSYFRIKEHNKTDENKYNNSSNDYNSSIENLKFLENNKNYKNSVLQNYNGFNSPFSTDQQTKKNSSVKTNSEKITIITNKDVVEFKYGDSFTEEENNSGKKSNNKNNNSVRKKTNINTNNYLNSNSSYNVLNSSNDNYPNILTNKNIIKIKTEINEENMIKSCIELKYWLDNIDLSIYYENFIENNIYDINTLVKQMKKEETKLGYDDIENILKIHKPGHIYRLLCNLEVDSGLINESIAKFLIKKNKNKKKDINLNKSGGRLKLSLSQQNSSCINCFRINFLSGYKKNDLKSFLSRYNLSNFYQNFYHNGFNLLNFIILQMYSSEPIDEDILENCFHIYEVEQREIVLKCIKEEKNKIDFFLNSNEYLNYESKDIINYEDIIFEEDKGKENEKMNLPNTSACTDCIII